LKISDLFEPNIRTTTKAMNEDGPFCAAWMGKNFMVKHMQK
jgi:hypothetical protein